MSDFTIGDFATALEGIVESLNGIAEELKLCDQAAEIDNTPGWSAICEVPVVVAEKCVAPVRESFAVADLLETVVGIRDWIGDVRSKLGNYSPETLLDSGSWPQVGETTD